MAHNFKTVEGTEVFNVNDAIQGSHALTLDDVKNFVTGTLSDTLHSNETQAVPYTGTELPVIAGVTAGDTVTTNFTNGVAHYTFDGTNWVVDFFTPAGFAIDTLCDATNTPVIVFADENGALTYKNPDNTPYTGDPSLLGACCCTVSPIVSADANNDITVGSDGGAFFNETVTTLGIVVGGAGLPNTATYTNENGVTTSFNYIEGARNNLQLGSPIVERGNVSLGGGQPADFIRNTYNWLGANYQDKWQSAGDANLFDIKANQTVNAANTTNSGAGAVNIGTLGANGQYKLNVHGGIWLDNGRNSQFIGNQAGLNNIMSEQIGIGTRANMNSIASFNDAIGFEALMTNTTGSFNTCFGNQSMRNANGFANVGLGFATLYLNQGAYNVAIGTNALLSNVSGIMNFAIGYNSMVLNNSGSRNIGIGYSSLYSTNSGWQNIGIGAEAMQQNISGNNNVAIGDLALQFNTTSSNNTTIGIQSQRYGTGYWNVGVGNFNQLYGKNCNYNTSLGGNTMYQNRYASNNVALGYESMYALNNVNAPSLIAGKQYEIVSQGTSDFTLVGSPNNNVGTIFTATGSTVGTGTTASITDIPNNNTAVGFQSLYATQGFSGNVALGYQAGYGTTGSNRLYIENSSDSVTPLIGGNFATDELIIGGVQKFSIQYPTTGAGVSNGSIFYGTDGALYFKGGSGTVTMIAPN